MSEFAKRKENKELDRLCREGAMIKFYSTVFHGLHKNFDVVENNCSSTRSQEQPKESVGQFGGVLDKSTINPLRIMLRIPLMLVMIISFPGQLNSL